MHVRPFAQPRRVAAGSEVSGKRTVVVLSPRKEALVRPGPGLFFLAVLTFSSLTLSTSIRAQSKIAALPLLSRNVSGDCRAFSPLRLTWAGSVPLDGRVPCAGLNLARKDVPSDGRGVAALNPLRADSADPIDSELWSMGKHGREILATRNDVLSVLEGHTGCSAWYLSKEPDAVAMFRSLHLALDTHGPGLIRKIVSAEGLLYIQPYVARAQQSVGPGSIITVNAHGAFFEEARGVVAVRDEGGPAMYETARLIRVGNYRGGTEEARVLTLLHEFGHVIDLLPLDAGVPDGPEISMHNTDLVLAHCKAQVEAVSHNPKKNSLVNPALLRASAHL